jgi:pimeloyl-ACP methyl ester carboxylesterase
MLCRFRRRRVTALAMLPIVFCTAWVLQPAFAQSAAFPATGEGRLERSIEQLRGAGSAVARSELFDSTAAVAWTVYWPNNESGQPPGVLVYVSPGSAGYLDPRWRESLDRANLALVSADNSGNEVLSAQRMALAVLGLDVLRSERPIDAERVYVSGFSGGGQVASTLAALYPDLFRGGIYICGADYWQEDYRTDLDRLRKNRFVFLTGTKDFSRHSVRVVYGRYVKAGVDQSRLMIIPRMGHEHPGAADFAAALDYLTARAVDPLR